MKSLTVDLLIMALQRFQLAERSDVKHPDHPVPTSGSNEVTIRTPPASIDGGFVRMSGLSAYTT